MKCDKVGEYRFTWPGSNESFIYRGIIKPDYFINIKHK